MSGDAQIRPARGMLLLAALVLSGCTLGPDFQRPTPPPENSIVAGPQPADVHVGERIADDWYQVFGSDDLDRLVREALRDNPDLQAARAAIGTAQLQLAQTRGQSLPQLNGRALINRARINSGALTGNPQAPASVNDIFAGILTLSYNLDPFGELTRSVEAGRAQVAYARAQSLNTYITLVDQVVNDAFRLAAAQARIDATEKLADAQRRQLKLVELQEQAGTVARAATLTARAQLQGTEASLPALQQQHDAATAALAALLGRTPGGFEAPQLRLSDFSKPRQAPLSLPSQLVAQRPDILAAEATLHQASAEIGVAAAARLPSFSLSASYGTLAGKTAMVFDPTNALWALGSNISAPLFHGGTLKAKEDAAKTRYLEATARYRGTVLKAFSEVASDLRALQHDDDTLKARAQALQTSEQALQLSQLQFRAGAVDELQVLTAQQEYRNELLAQIAAQAQRFSDYAALFHALGGGWWNAPHDPVRALTAADYDTEHSSNSTVPVSAGGH